MPFHQFIENLWNCNSFSGSVFPSLETLSSHWQAHSVATVFILASFAESRSHVSKSVVQLPGLVLTPEPVNSVRKEIELKNAELWPLFKVPNFTLLYVIIFVPYLRRGKGKALLSLNNQPCCQVFETISSVANDLAEWRWWRHTVCLFYKSTRSCTVTKAINITQKLL